MLVFITGASGHVGSALIPELLAHGHHVVGLARSDDAAATVAATGAEVLRGDLDDLDGLGAAAAAADGVIHLAFKHDAMAAGDYQTAIESDLAAIGAMAGALDGTDKPFVGTSGTLMLAFGGVEGTGTEDIVLEAGPRTGAENFVIALADRGVRSSVVRLPPTVHSSLDHHGFIPMIIGFAREHGEAAYIGDGANRWPAGHTLDAARLYRLALEGAPAGTRLHAVGDEGVAFRAIAETIGRNLGIPTVSVTAEEAPSRFSYLATFAGLDNPTSSAATQSLLDWHPTEAGLLADLDEGHYFHS
ncbi:SDR family oxidoreductase [Aquihabitans sp. G128]|uniref:SDR family oxidoreductase n=1 Tax=Aquihabitans sp. G128 TaxID=2849779 RepID=UPI001C23F8B8|nr:SDR family oxidoreductase [Aquihabitans sp. G128]QXC61728.1 SDR family oxidoreductase [Aquihabitans sp. G128]